jgi:cytochrome c peroxidase
MQSKLPGIFVFPVAVLLLAVSCTERVQQQVAVDPAMLPAFGVMPNVMESPDNPVTPGKVALGRMLYFEKRLSKSQEISCNTCHPLDQYGAEAKSVSDGHKGQQGSRNAPTVFNAAAHVAQFWDGRAKTVEEQAKGPIMNPVEMAMPSEEDVIAVLQSIQEYRDAFKAAFPGERNPVTIDNMAKAIGAFERTLSTPSRWDRFLAGDTGALTNEEKAGFNKFAEVGCTACHSGPLVGAAMFQKMGIQKPWPVTSDPGRFAVTHEETDRMVFKVPSLRNVEKTGPYYHDGSVATLETAVKDMGEYQLGRSLKDEEVGEIVSWLKTLSGQIPSGATRPLQLPPSSASTPKPDPS